MKNLGSGNEMMVAAFSMSPVNYVRIQMIRTSGLDLKQAVSFYAECFIHIAKTIRIAESWGCGIWGEKLITMCLHVVFFTFLIFYCDQHVITD